MDYFKHAMYSLKVYSDVIIFCLLPNCTRETDMEVEKENFVNVLRFLYVIRVNNNCESHLTHSSHRVLPFWLLVAPLVRGAAMPLMQCPYYQYIGAHFADLGRMTG